MDVNWLEKRVEDRPALEDKCQGMGRLIDAAVDNLGRIITDLRPSILDHQGLWAALEWQAQEFVETTELRHDVQVHVVGRGAAAGGRARRTLGDRGVPHLPGDAQQRGAPREGAARCEIRLYVDGPPQPVLHLEVRDDGVGAERDRRFRTRAATA